MFDTAFSPFWASWGLGVATARSVVKNQCGGTTRELWGWIMGRFRGRRLFRKLIFGNLVTWLVSPHYRPYGGMFSRPQCISVPGMLKSAFCGLRPKSEQAQEGALRKSGFDPGQAHSDVSNDHMGERQGC